MPDGAAGEAIDLRDAHPCRRPGGVLDLLRRPLPDALRIAVAPNIWGQHTLVPLVDEAIGHRLAHQVGTNGVAAQPMPLQDRLPLGDVRIALQRFVHLEVIAPASQLQAVVAPAPGLLG